MLPYHSDKPHDEKATASLIADLEGFANQGRLARFHFSLEGEEYVVNYRVVGCDELRRTLPKSGGTAFKLMRIKRLQADSQRLNVRRKMRHGYRRR